MYGRVCKPGTLQTAQLVEEKGNAPMVSDCMTRMMTPEDWEKYGPLILRGKKRKKNSYLSGF